MNSPRKQAFTLVELLVVIAIILTLFCLVSPHGQQSREGERKKTCKHNLKQLHTALLSRETSQKNFPGYINTLGQPNGYKTRASWVVKTFDYIEQAPLSARWEQGEYVFPPIEILECPSDPAEKVEQPNLSYVANTGYIDSNTENKANGIFFDLTRTAAGAPGPEDERDKASAPEIIMTIDYIQSHDGATRTLLLSENNNALFWGYTTPVEQQTLPDQKYHFGFCWEQPAVIANTVGPSLRKSRRINGNDGYEMKTKFKELIPNDGFPSSNHPGGVNVAFVGGNVSFLDNQIDPLVYAQLMTPNGKESDLKTVEGKPESELKPPADQY